MYQNMFPVTIIDNFYPDPDVVRNFALEQDYTPSENGGWPGKRTKDISELDEELHDFFMKSIMNIFYPMEYRYEYHLENAFQLIESRNENQYSAKNKGWIHHDAMIFGGVVYLTKDPEPDTGTSIYRPKKCHHQHKQSWIRIKSEDYLGDCGLREEEYEKSQKEQYSNFDESITIQNVYNRCVLFGGNVLHAQKTFGTRKGNDARLTQSFFCHSLDFSMYMDTYPLCRPYNAG